MVQKSLLIPSIIICPNSFAEQMLLDWGLQLSTRTASSIKMHLVIAGQISIRRGNGSAIFLIKIRSPLLILYYLFNHISFLFY
jgi:hypothetical protein